MRACCVKSVGGYFHTNEVSEEVNSTHSMDYRNKNRGKKHNIVKPPAKSMKNTLH